VRFLGPIDHDALLAMMPVATAVLSFYEVSNLGNVALEALGTGSVLLSLADGSLDAIVRDGKSALLVDDVERAADAVLRLVGDQELGQRLQRGARAAADAHLLSWDERVAREIAVIEDAAAGRQVEA
jgi:glycosyltransferase involved in cell wall biosynthesis